MSRNRRVVCPMCGHETPAPRSRDYLTCTCGLRLACERGPATRPVRGQSLLALLTVATVLAAAADLLRRLR